jgi:TRAP-type C4-dicarboxylate transport system substrate-binding protein
MLAKKLAASTLKLRREQKLKNRILVITLVLALCVSIITIGCGQESGNQGNGSAEGTIVLKFAHHWAPQSVSGRGFQYFADAVNEKSDGQIKVEVYPADSLVTGAEMYEAMLDDIVDIGYVTTSQISPRISELNVMEIPGIYDSSGGDFDYFTYAAEVKPYLENIYGEYGLKFLYEIDQGDMVICSTQPIQDLGDFKGKRIRDYGVWAGRALETLGVAPMTIPPGDCALSLERNTVDGAFGTWGFVDGFKLYELAPHITWLNMGGISAHVFLKQETWDAFTSEQQQIISEAASEAMQKHSEFLKETELSFIETSEAEGSTHYQISDEMRKEMLNKFDAVFEQTRDVIGTMGNELLDKLQSMR